MSKIINPQKKIFTLGILICDHVNELLQPKFDDYPFMFNQLFERQSNQFEKNNAFELIFFNVVDNDFPKSIDDCDAYMTSGSKQGVNDNLPWIDQLEVFIRDLYEHNKPFIGICFGHQLMAKALGGRVAKSDKGWGVGIHTCLQQQKQRWMKTEKSQLNLIVSHQDQIQTLPANTQVLYSSEFCPYSMIQVGEHFIGMQGHPEFTTSYSSALMEMRKNIIPENIRQKGQLSFDKKLDSKEITGWLIDFIKLN